MTKLDITKDVAFALGIKQDEAQAVVEAVIWTIKEGISDGKDIFLRGFGTFKIITRKAKLGRNITKGSFVNIPERKVIKFIPNKKLAGKVREL